MTGLITALLLAQAVQPTNWINWTTYTTGAPGPYVAVPLALPLSSTGPLLPEDAGTVSHVYWTESALVDTVGNAWTQNGTVPQVAASVSPFVPGKAGAGPYSAANSYQGPTTLGEWTGDWSVTVVAKFGDTASVEYLYGKYPTSGTGGWILYKGGSGNIINYVYDGALKGASCPGAHIVGGISVITIGRSGGVNYCRMNGGASGTVAAGAALSASAEPIRIGRYGGAGYATTTTIYEILASTTPYSDALHDERFRRVFGLAPGPVTVTRADPITYTANGFVWSAPPATMGIGSSGAEVWKGSTNYVLNSELLGAAAGGWTEFGAPTVTADQCAAPNGTTTMDRISAAGDSSVYRTTTVPSSVGPFTSSAWVRAWSGTQTQRVDGSCNSVNTTACACVRSDGGACTASATGTTTCAVEATNVGTTPVRLSAVYTCASAIINPLSAVRPGPIGSAGDGCFWGVQLEASAYPTPYIATTGTATARAATVSSVPLPANALGDKFCISVTATPGGRAWQTDTGYHAIVGQGVNLSCVSNDATGFYKYSTGTVGFLTENAAGDCTVAFASGFTGTAPYRITGCNSPGAVTLYRDGVLIATTPTGRRVSAGTMKLGADIAGIQTWDGSISNLKICRGATKYAECR